MTANPRKPPGAGVALALCVAGACASPPAGEAPRPIDHAIVLRGLAPGYAREAIVEPIADDADLAALPRTWRLDEASARRLLEPAAAALRWWLVVPPAPPSGGYRLRVALDDGVADACLAPPRGAATSAFEKPAYLVGLPRNAGPLRWRGDCP